MKKNIEEENWMFIISKNSFLLPILIGEYCTSSANEIVLFLKPASLTVVWFPYSIWQHLYYQMHTEYLRRGPTGVCDETIWSKQG
jgi:hypothetical protein